MISSIHLQNFQSHEDSLIEFSPGVNVIIGPSRNGKTAVLRALRWVAENRPLGDGFRSHWAGKEGVEVGIELEGEQVVTRVKSAIDNYYDVNGQPFRAFGQAVPEPVSQTLSLAPINVQYQFDAPFLLFDSPGEVARYLNKIVHLDKIDSALAASASRRRAAEGEAKIREASLKVLEEQEEAFPDLDEIEAYIQELEAKEVEIFRLSTARDRLSENLTSLVALRPRLRSALDVATCSTHAELLIEKKNLLDQLIFTEESLLTLSKNISEAKVAGLHCQEKIRLAQAIDELTSMATRLKVFQASKQGLKSKTENILSLQSCIWEKQAIIDKRKEEFKRRFPDVCPLCGKAGN